MTGEFSFALEVEGFDVENDEHLDALYGAFEDVGASVQSGRVTIGFVVAARGASHALGETTDRLEAVVPTVRVLRVDRDLVSIPDIADRTDRTPESVRLLVGGKRGLGGFPAPCGTLGGGIRVWEWATVAGWFAQRDNSVEGANLIDHESATLFDARLLNRYTTDSALEPVPVKRATRRVHRQMLPAGQAHPFYDQATSTRKGPASRSREDLAV
ncbi:MAG: hypothetical protein JJE52_03115 [Acidimicrobiia bacterium]|nr:hypothetical protein [Acidimicrobiia bacterium]